VEPSGGPHAKRMASNSAVSTVEKPADMPQLRGRGDHHPCKRKPGSSGPRRGPVCCTASGSCCGKTAFQPR